MSAMNTNGTPLMMITIIVTDQTGSQHTWQEVLIGKTGPDIQIAIDNCIDEMLLEKAYIRKSRLQKRDELARFKNMNGGNQ